jgi:simple sugar transport system permease protein
MDLTFFTDYLAASLRLSVPIAFAALGGLFSERSGVLNIGLEGMMLAGAFASAAAAFSTGNVWLGVLAALTAGGIVGLLHAYLCVTLRVDQLVSGLALNLASAGLTSFLSRLVFSSGSTQQLPAIPTAGIPALKDIPIIGALLFNQDPLVYFLFLLVPLSTYILFRTGIGLSLRAVGEYPRAADTAGVSVATVRYLSVTLSGCLSGFGGAYLALVHVRFFTEEMSAGKGFIALAALILAGGTLPVPPSPACFSEPQKPCSCAFKPSISTSPITY